MFVSLPGDKDMSVSCNNIKGVGGGGGLETRIYWFGMSLALSQTLEEAFQPLPSFFFVSLSLLPQKHKNRCVSPRRTISVQNSRAFVHGLSPPEHSRIVPGLTTKNSARFNASYSNWFLKTSREGFRKKKQNWLYNIKKI